MSGRWSGGLRDGTKILMVVVIAIAVVVVVFGL